MEQVVRTHDLRQSRARVINLSTLGIVQTLMCRRKEGRMNRRKPLSEDFVLELLDNTIGHYPADGGRCLQLDSHHQFREI